jgi:hypothetical protein
MSDANVFSCCIPKYTYLSRDSFYGQVRKCLKFNAFDYTFVLFCFLTIKHLWGKYCIGKTNL